MSERIEQSTLPCPACSPGFGVSHNHLSSGGGLVTVKCTDCGHVHKTDIPEPNRVAVPVIVSQDDDSFAETMDRPSDEVLHVGDEFVLDTDDAILGLQITSIEIGDEQRVENEQVSNIKTVWTRVIDNLEVNVTIHPPDGSDQSRSISVPVPGDYEFTVGAEETFDDESVTILGILLRDSESSGRLTKLDHDGDSAYAKDIKRLYARDETMSSWSPW